MRNLGRGLAAVAVALAALLAVPSAAVAEDTQPMHRLYNPNSGEHFYTASAGERDNLLRLGWQGEGVGWVAPATSDTPVYRLYNPNGGDHHYTTSAGERDLLIGEGWQFEGVGWYSDDEMRVPLYRQYNPNAKSGSHNYTASSRENDNLVALGWNNEGIGWYGVEGPSPQEPQEPQQRGADVASQIELIAQNEGLWGAIGGSVEAGSCALCDLDHDGLLEVISITAGGTGRFTFTDVYEVNQDITALEKREQVLNGNSLPDWFRSEQVTTYELNGRYAYMLIDSSRTGYNNYAVTTVEVVLEGSNIVYTDLCSKTGYRSLHETEFTVTFRDANLNPISEDEYNTMEANRYAGWRQGTTTIKSVSRQDWEADIIGALTSSWEGFSFE